MEFLVNVVELHSEVTTYTGWAPGPLPGPAGEAPFLPDEYDVKYKWYLVQFPAGYFSEGTHVIEFHGYSPNPHHVLNVLYGGDVYGQIVIDVSE